MRRNQPARSKRPPERGTRPAAEGPPHGALSSPQATKQSPPPPESPGTSTIAGQRPRYGLTSRICLIAFVIVYCGLVFLLLSTRWRLENWPTIQDIGIVPTLGAVGAGLLLAAGFAAWLARRLAQSNNRISAKVSLLVALVCAGLFVGLRWYEYGDLHAAGLWRRSTAGPIYEQADIYYLQAVRFRLDELFLELDERRADRPNEFTGDDTLRMEIITDLQTNMVDWTEHEVGHWLEDLQQRRAVMEQVAYQVFPLARNQDAVTSNVQEQLREIERQRQWFNVLYDYCREKSKLLGHTRQPAGEPGSKVAAPQSLKTVGPSDPTLLVSLNREVSEKLDALGLTGWSYAQSVMTDASDAAITGERLSQIAARLDAMEGRAAFLSDVKVWEFPETEGLNRKYRWLRLPVCLPGGNAWVGGYLALTGLHLLLLSVVVLLSLWLLLVRIDNTQVSRWPHVAWWWYVSSFTGAALFPLFYLF